MSNSYQDLKITFLKKFALGQKTNLRNSEQVIKKCIALAYKDMMTAGKYYLEADLGKGNCEKTQKNKEREERFYTLLCAREFVFSQALIDEVCALFADTEKIESAKGYVTAFGLAQKLVNMTYKYLFVFSNEIGRTVDFSRCDCPLDSIIIGKLGRGDIWSKLDRTSYDDLQQQIDTCAREYPEYHHLGRLAYDFKNW